MPRETSTDDGVLARYLREINRVPLLTRDQEERLARRAADGDTEAKEDLARANLRFVVNVAKRKENCNGKSQPAGQLGIDVNCKQGELGRTRSQAKSIAFYRSSMPPSTFLTAFRTKTEITFRYLR